MLNDNVLELALSGTELSLSATENNEVIEFNNYTVSVSTSENLTDCTLLMRKYGQNIPERFEPFIPRIERLVSFYYNNKGYWGKLIYSETKLEPIEENQLPF